MRLPLLINKKILSIDFGSHRIKVIEGQVSKKDINISKSFIINLPKDIYNNGEILDKGKLSIILKNFLKENKISTNLAYGIINSSDIITREISIPRVTEKEVSSIIEYQLVDFLPVNPEDYVVNHLIIGNRIEDEVEKLNILLVGIPKNMVINHLELMKDIGLKPQVLDYQGNTIAKLLGFNRLINEYYNTRDIVIASIDMGYSSSKLTIIKNGNMEVSRVIDIGAKKLYKDLELIFDYSLEDMEQKIIEIEDIAMNTEESTDYYKLLSIIRATLTNIMEKVEMILRYYITREIGNNINFILLQGGLSNINGVDNLFSNYFSIPSIKLSTLDNIKWLGDLNRFSNAIGGLIRFNEV